MFEWRKKYVFGYYETKENQFGRQPRLQVEYDSSILETYSDLSIDNHVYNVIKPIVLEKIEK